MGHGRRHHLHLRRLLPPPCRFSPISLPLPAPLPPPQPSHDDHVIVVSFMGGRGRDPPPVSESRRFPGSAWLACCPFVRLCVATTIINGATTVVLSVSGSDVHELDKSLLLSTSNIVNDTYRSKLYHTLFSRAS
jgi:hypothetical protein